MSIWKRRMDLGLFIGKEGGRESIVAWDKKTGNLLPAVSKLEIIYTGDETCTTTPVKITTRVFNENICYVDNTDECVGIIEKSHGEPILGNSTVDEIARCRYVDYLERLKKRIEERIYDLQKGTI